jgi:hypothetical protein
MVYLKITGSQYCGSMKFWCGSGSARRGSIPLTDGSGSGFDLQDVKKTIFFFAYYFLRYQYINIIFQ